VGVWLVAFLLAYPMWKNTELVESSCREDWGRFEIVRSDYDALDETTKRVCPVHIIEDVPVGNQSDPVFIEPDFDEIFSKADESPAPVDDEAPVTCNEDFGADLILFCDKHDVICAPSTPTCGKEVDGINECRCPVSAAENKYNWVIFVTTFLIPLFVIVYCYTRFLHSIYSVTKNVSTSTAMSTTHQDEIRRLTILIMTLIAAFLICWTPVQVTGIMRTSGMLSNVCSTTCKVIIQLKKNLVWVSAVINSLIYLSTTGFRRQLKETVKKAFKIKERRASVVMDTTPMTERITLSRSTYSDVQHSKSELLFDKQ